MSFGEQVVSAAKLIPMFNIGPMFDLITGSYHIGKYGQSVLNGGLGDINSVIGVGHSFKSTLETAIHLIVNDRIHNIESVKYDSETSFTYGRFNELSIRLPRLNKVDFENPDDPGRKRFVLTNSGTLTRDGKIQYGDIFHDTLTKYVRELHKVKNLTLFTTPFFDGTNQIKIKKPLTVSLDSVTKMQITAVEEGNRADHKIGDSERNTDDLSLGRFKKQLNDSLIMLCRLGELRVTMTAHTQKILKMGGRFEVDKQSLVYGKREFEIKGVGTSFMQVNGVIYDIQHVAKLDNDTAKTGVLYPLVDSDRDEHCKDLNLLTVVISRNKYGHTGTVLKIIVSQREGMLLHLSAFKSLRDSNNFGLIGDSKKQASVFLPELFVQRTTVRGIINENYAFRRALEISSDLLQMKYLFSPESNELWCTPEELYESIKSLGYDWNTLLSHSRSWWTFEEEDNDNLPFLSTMDLLRIRKGPYKPYWLFKDFIKTTKGFLKETLELIPKDQLL